MSPEIRTLGEDGLRGWLETVSTAFLTPPAVSDEEVAHRAGYIDFARAQGAYDDGRCVATFRSFAQQLTVVGGARLPADAVSAVTVLPTHRRRGLLSRMMETDLRAAKERGDPVATLVAAEYPIYGRFGFGPSTWAASWLVDVPRTGLDPRHAVPEDGGRVDFASAEEVRSVGPGLHDRLCDRLPGMVSRPSHWWETATGSVRFPGAPWTEPFHVIHRSPSGTVEGLATYTIDGHWDAGLPQNTVRAQELIATTPAAERALWQFLCSIDLVSRVHSGRRAPDDVLPHLFTDPRAVAVQDRTDFLWLRPLDIPRLLEARTYPAAGSLVLEVEDRAGLAGGRFLLTAGPDGAACAPTTRAAELTLDVGEFAALYLGDTAASRLAAYGRVQEERPGALATADLLLHTPRRPWCADVF